MGNINVFTLFGTFNHEKALAVASSEIVNFKLREGSCPALVRTALRHSDTRPPHSAAAGARTQLP